MTTYIDNQSIEAIWGTTLMTTYIDSQSIEAIWGATSLCQYLGQFIELYVSI